MPYKTNEELPSGIKVLPSNAQSMWREVFNSAYSKAGEDSARKQAWGAVKRKYVKNKEGKWVAMKKEDISFIKESPIEITKVDEEQRIVFGFFNINKINGILLKDLQGHVMETEELEKAAYDFILNARDQGNGHKTIGVGKAVESFMITKEKVNALLETVKSLGVEDPVMDLGIEGWWGGFKVTDDKTWDSVKKGELPMFSVGGKCKELVEITED